MNIIDIVKNAPEGATHYSPEAHEFYLTYFKDNGCLYLVPTESASEWVSKKRPLPSYEGALPLPKLKTEWVKVEGSIFELEPDLKAGELYCGANGDESVKLLVKTESHLVLLRHEGRPIYRKIENVIDEKQEFLDEFNRAFELWNSGFGSLAEYLYGLGFRFIKPE